MINSDVFALAVAAWNDTAYQESVEKVQNAFDDLINAEADGRRAKTATLIKAKFKIEMELQRFESEYSRIAEQLSPEAQKAVAGLLQCVEQKLKDLKFEKQQLRTHR